MKFSAVILAGGKSSRMGFDKAFLEIDGRKLLDRQLDTLVAAGAEDIIISGRSGVNYSAYSCRVLEDQFADAGPLGGIHAALTVSRQPLLLVLAVDMPEMNALFLRSLLMASTSDGGVITRLDETIEPLVALYPQAALKIVRQMFTQKNYAVRRLAEACVRERLATYFQVPAEFARLFRNLNSPADRPCPI